MQYTTRRAKRYFQWGSVAHTVVLTVTGHQVEGLEGWLASPPRLVQLEGAWRSKKRDCGGGFAWRVGWAWM